MMEDAAIELFEAGYKIVPLWPNAKNPRVGEHWPDFELLDTDIKTIFQNTGNNIGVITGKRSSLVAVDIDKKSAAREFYKNHKQILKTIVETRKGAHFWFQHPGKEVGNGKHRTGDIRADGGQVVAPTSFVDGWTYRYVDRHGLVRPEELPLFDYSLVEDVTQKVELTRGIVSNVDGYLSEIYAIQGQYGSKALMRAIYICRDAGLSDAETMIRLVRWNETNAVPRWSDKELLRAVSNGYRKEKIC